MNRCAAFQHSNFLPKLSGDVQGETGQSNASPSASTHPHPPHQLPPLGLRLLARAGLRGPGDVGPLPATSCRVAIFGLHRSHHHRLQPHGSIGRIQPDGAPPEHQGPGCGGDVAADVQDYQRSGSLTDGSVTSRSDRRDNAKWTSEQYAAGVLKLPVTMKMSHLPAHPRRGLESP